MRGKQLDSHAELLLNELIASVNGFFKDARGVVLIEDIIGSAYPTALLFGVIAEYAVGVSVIFTSLGIVPLGLNGRLRRRCDSNISACLRTLVAVILAGSEREDQHCNHEQCRKCSSDVLHCGDLPFHVLGFHSNVLLYIYHKYARMTIRSRDFE